MDWLSAPYSEWWPFLFILLAGALPTHIWRWAGALLSRSMDEDGEVIKWVKAVATALVAGLIANLVIFPSGDLAAIPIAIRVGALAFGYAVYFFTPKTILFGILAGEAFLVAGALLFAR